MNAKTDSEMAINYPPRPGSDFSKASEVNAAPVSPDDQAPDAMIAKPVIEHTMIVSMNVPSIAIRP